MNMLYSNLHFFFLLNLQILFKVEVWFTSVKVGQISYTQNFDLSQEEKIEFELKNQFTKSNMAVSKDLAI